MNGTFSLASAYQSVLERIGRACLDAGRDPAEVRLLAVSKTRTPDEVAALAALGQQAMGENYLQEALTKQEALAALPLHWHFIGPIQSNKTRKIAEHFDWVHSVESLRIAKRLSDQRPADRGLLNVCLQVNVSGEESKSGCAPDEAVALASEIATLPGLALRGLMAIPEPTDDPAVQAQRFGLLRRLHEDIRHVLRERESTGGKPAIGAGAENIASDLASTTGDAGEDNRGTTLAERFDTLSMGMSDDLEAAIAAGSTMVRIGTALFGPRPPKAPATT